MGEYREKIKKPYFSVILPIYNVEAYLRDCVESVLSQDFEDYELILVDDGSADSCPAICDEYAERYAHVRVLHKENGGLSSARNAGLDVAQGEYIWWVDSDDWIEDGALRRLWSASRESMPDIVKFSYYRSGDNIEKANSGIEPGVYGRGNGLEPLLERAFYQAGSFCLSAWSHVYRRDLIVRNALSFVSERLVGSEDYLFNLQVLPLADSVAVLADALYYYRLRQGSLSQNYRANLAEKYTKLCQLLIESYKENGSYDPLRRKLNYFYVWHLIYGTCISREYGIDRRKKSLGRETVRALLRSPSLQEALVNGAGDRLHRKRYVHYLAMRMKFEPFFHWLFVIKPKKGTEQQ